MRFSVVISLLLHVVFLIIMLSNHHLVKSPKIIQVTINETKSSSSKSAEVRHGHGKSLPTLKQLMVKKAYGQFGLSFQNQSGQYSDALTDNVKSNWGSGSGDFSRIGQLSLMMKIHRQMENLLYYPSVLAYHQVEGNVNARLVLNEKGSCDWNQTSISSDSAYLKIFVLDLMKTLCKNNWGRELSGRKLTNVDFSFQFAITEHDDWKFKEEQNRIVGNVLLFYTNAQHSVAEWNVGPFKGMFPIPVISLDFQWLQENWEKVIEGKDPYREFKREHRENS